MRRLALLLLALVVAPAATASSTAKVFAVKWHDRKDVGDGYLLFDVSRIEVDGRTFRVTGRIANRTGHTIVLRRPRDYHLVFHSSVEGDVKFTYRTKGFGIAWLGAPGPYPSAAQSDGAFAGAAATRFAPRLPTTLRNGKSWTGRFAGEADLPRAKPLWVSFGYISIRGVRVLTREWLETGEIPPDGFTWYTNGSFELK